MNTAKVQWMRQGVNGYGVGLVVEGGTWLGDTYVAGDYVGIPATMVAGVDYIDRDRTTLATVPAKPTNWMAVAGLGAVVLMLFIYGKRKRGHV